MKKFMMMLAMVALPAMTFVSCGSDDDEEEVTPTVSTFTSGTIEGTIGASGDGLQYFNITYIEQLGADANENVSAFTDTVKNVSITLSAKDAPKEITLGCGIAAKEGLTFPIEIKELSFNFNLEAKTYDQNGKEISRISKEGIQTEDTTTLNNLEEYNKYISVLEKTVIKTFILDENGKLKLN